MKSLDFKEVVSFEFWAFSSAICLMLVLLAMFLYLYYRMRLKAVAGDSGNEAEIASNVEQLKKDEKAIRNWIESQNDELQRLNAERNEQEIIRGELQRIEQECVVKEEFNRSLRDEVGVLENLKYQLSSKNSKLEKDNEGLAQKIATLERNKEKLESYVKRITSEATEKKKEFEKLDVSLEQKTRELSDTVRRLNEIKIEVDSLQFKENSLHKKIESLQESEQQIEVMNKRLLELKQDLEDTRHEVSIQQNLEDKTARQVKNLYYEIDEINSKKGTTNSEVKELETLLERRKTEFHNVDSQVDQIKETLSEKRSELTDTKQELAIQQRLEDETALKIQKNEEKVEKLKAEETKLNATIKTLEVLAKKRNIELGVGEKDTKDGVKYRDLWQPVTFAELTPSQDTPIEQSLLQNTADYIKGQQLYFPERVLHAFHTALKVNDISPLVVLAGISGTGKSELPRRYAEGMGMHSVILAVQPRWDSPQDLFGFYNYLEERYKATELARAMVQFEQFNGDQWPLPDGWSHDRSDRMLLVLLDEMNLARVEYYFSEFLSRLETRRGIDLKVATERSKAEIAIEMGSLAEGENPIRLFPGQNVLFSGTMNEDETTQALSDKVLDRSCVLRFGRPKKIKSKENVKQLPPAKNGLTHAQWRSYLSDDLPAGEKDRVNVWINKLNDAMELLDRPFGHRVAQAIQSYVANYPSWIENRVTLAMADQIEQRIMPKLRGVETGEAEQPLIAIQSVIQECDDTLLLDAFRKGANSQQGIFIWRGLDRTEELH